MAFTPKAWKSYLEPDTPVSAAALIDLEERLSDYSDEVAAGGIELGYAERTSNFIQTGAGNSDVPSMSVAVTVGSRPIIVKARSDGVGNSSASGVGQFRIMEGATVLSVATFTFHTVQISTHLEVRLAPSAGAHTYKVNLIQLVTGNIAVLAGAEDPAFIQVVEV